MNEESIRELRRVFVKEMRNNTHVVDKDEQVSFFAKPPKRLEIEKQLLFTVTFLREEFAVTIMDIAKTDDYTKMLIYLNGKNKQKIYGKYYITDTGHIVYRSLSWVPDSDEDTSCIHDLIQNCLEELSDDFEEILVFA